MSRTLNIFDLPREPAADAPVREETVLTTLWAFRQVAEAFAMGAGDLKIFVHPVTRWTILRENAFDRTGPTGQSEGARMTTMGIAVEADPHVPAGILRIVYRNEHCDLPMDIAVKRAKAGRGGLVEVSVRCWACDWSVPVTEGMAADDAFASAHFLAQRHREQTGHGVTVSGQINLGVRT